MHGLNTRKLIGLVVLFWLLWALGAQSVTLAQQITALDVDGNGQEDALTDGILILRRLFQFSGESLVANAVAPDCTVCTPAEVEDSIAVLQQQSQLEVDCDAGDSLQQAVSNAANGATIVVSGTCNESVTFGFGKRSITVDGQGSASVIGPDAGLSTIRIRGRNITIRNFNGSSISGGNNGILVDRGGFATIDNNTIENVGNNGISVLQGGIARIVNNTIQNNPNHGISVGEGSVARIGFLLGSEAQPNLIQGNGRDGILVTRHSSARIVGNTIRNNGDDGVNVTRLSQAEISDNVIEGNTDDGVNVVFNSGVNLGSDQGDTIFTQPNSTSDGSLNGGFGLACGASSYVDGRVGMLDGAEGDRSIFGSCFDSLAD